MTIRRLGPVAALVAAITILGGCANGAASAPATPTSSVTADTAYRIGVLFPGDAPYLSGYMQGIEQAAAEAGAELIIVNAQWEPDVQATQMDELLAQDPDGIIVWAVDAKAICPALAKAEAANIPMVATNSEVDESCADLVDAYTGPDDVAQGAAAADLMNEALEGQGNVLVIEGVAGTAPQIRRLQGFEEQLAEVAPDIKILDKQPADWDKTKAINVTRDLLTRYGDQVNGIFGQDDTLASGAAQAVADAGLEGSVAIIGLGGSGDGLKAVKDGTLYGTMIQSPVFDGSYGVEALVNILNGGEQPAKQYLPVLPVTEENVGEYEPEW